VKEGYYLFSIKLNYFEKKEAGLNTYNRLILLDPVVLFWTASRLRISTNARKANVAKTAREF